MLTAALAAALVLLPSAAAATVVGEGTGVTFAYRVENRCPEGADPGRTPEIRPADAGVADDEVSAIDVILAPEQLDGSEVDVDGFPVRLSFADTILTALVPLGPDCGGEAITEPSPTPTPTPEPEPTPTPTPTPTPEPSPTPGPTPTATAEPTPDPGPSPTPEPEATVAPAPEPEPELASSVEGSPSPTPSPTPTPSPEPPPSPSPEPQPEPELGPDAEDGTEVLGTVLERDPPGDSSAAPLAAGLGLAAAAVGGGVLLWRRRKDLLDG